MSEIIKKIVLVEDEVSLANIMADELKYAFSDCEVITFNDPREALNYVKSETNVYTVITDGRMPYMNGLELVREIRSLGKKTPVFLVTGHMDGLQDIRNEGLFERVFEKPIDFDTLISSISSSLSA